MDFRILGFVKRVFRMEPRLVILEGQYLVTSAPLFGRGQI